MALTVKKTEATLGGSINVRTELHGDEPVGAVDFKIDGILIDKDDLNELYDDKYYWASIYNQRGKLTEPMTKKNQPMEFKGKFENSTVTLWMGLDGDEEATKITECKLRRITIEPQTGGMTLLTLQVQCHPEQEILGLLYTHQGLDIKASIRFGREEKPKQKEQPELPMDHNAEKKDGDSEAVH